MDNYREISISPIISKVFEPVLLYLYEHFLGSSPYQFGCKKKTGCNHAHFVLEKTVNFLVERVSTVNLGSIDISKAFDKLNRFILFDKLIDRRCPVKFIMVLQCWLSKSTTTVLWNGHLSDMVSLVCGVRQGGILSPFLFFVYVTMYWYDSCHLK